MAKFVPLSEAEKNNETSLFAAIGAGIASGLIKTVEGVVSLGAELVDLGADSNTAADIEKFFDKINPFDEAAESRLAGKLTETLVTIGIPGGAGFRIGTKLADKALKAKKAGAYANFKGANAYKAALQAKKLNDRAGIKRFAAGVAGGATGETFVADIEDIGTFGDFFNAPTALDRDVETGREDALRKLMNRVKFGSESLFITPFVYGAGKTVKALAKRGEDDAYSNSAVTRWIDKYIVGPLSPAGDQPEAVFKAQMSKEALKASDTLRIKEITDNITREADKIFPNTSKFFDTTTNVEQQQFYKQLNDVLFEGDLRKPVNADASDKLIKLLKGKKVSDESIGKIISSLDDGRAEVVKLIDILEQSVANKKIVSSGSKEIKEIMKNKIQGWIGNTYKIFQTKSGLAKLMQTQPFTDEAYVNAINLFRRYLNKTSKDPVKLEKTEAGQFVPTGDKFFNEAKFIVDDIINQAQIKKKPGPLPDITYGNSTMMGAKTKSFAKAKGKGSKVFRQLFGEIEDPRYSLFNAVTNLSAVARTTAYLDDIAKQNKKVQKQGKRGFFWDSEEAAKAAVNAPVTGIKIVKVQDEILSKIPGAKDSYSSLSGKFTTEDIAKGIQNANDVGTGLTAIVRGREGANAAEKSVTWFYRNLLIFPKAISQLAKTVLSIPTHLRNFFSAGAFAGANGILFEGLFRPKLLAEAFAKGIDTSALLKLGPNNAKAQAAYRELLELGVVNSQVQIGDLINLLRDAGAGSNVAATDAILKPFVRKLKKLGSFLQGKYVAEDDTWKITNYVVELDRLKRAALKTGRIRNIDDIPDDVLRGLKEEAADIVKNTVPNYAFVGSAVKTSRILPIGNFMSFPSEIIRTTTNIAEQGLKELRHSKPVRGSNVTPYVVDAATGQLVKNDNPLYRTGITRLTGMATTLAVVPGAVVEGAQMLYDVTDEELQALRQFVPDWSKNSTLVPIKLDDGELRYIDFSHSNAYDVMARPFRTLVNNIIEGEQTDRTLLAGFVNGVGEASAEFMNPFISESIWTQATADIITRGGRTRDGRQLYTDQTSPGDKAKIRFLHLGEALAPGYKQFQRLGQAAFGRPTKRGDELEIGPELAGFMGLRAIKVDPIQSMGFKISEYQTGIRNARREFTGGFFGLLRGGPIKPNDVISRYYTSNKARFDVQQEMYKNINAAQILGADRARLRREFSDRQIGSVTFGNLSRAKFDPYYPSEDIQARFQEIADNLGQPNMFRLVQPTLRQMRSAFKNTPLTSSFDVSLDNFLLEEVATPQLPASVTSTTPTINPVRTAQVDPVSGLTQTETALLSPEEQIIRQRIKRT